MREDAKQKGKFLIWKSLYTKWKQNARESFKPNLT
jgi:hypothetical protein